MACISDAALAVRSSGAAAVPDRPQRERDRGRMVEQCVKQWGMLMGLPILGGAYFKFTNTNSNNPGQHVLDPKETTFMNGGQRYWDPQDLSMKEGCSFLTLPFHQTIRLNPLRKHVMAENRGVKLGSYQPLSLKLEPEPHPHWKPDWKWREPHQGRAYGTSYGTLSSGASMVLLLT
ncbi:hypothetical protein MDA_GLEAN10011432 [Myotis davidii]|uniref:Uncharacterized protein n=1 Tax=Myotis davidii TaxID=225400 RepID=L5MH22_MYODS|nr:hypothetical protein MDA_GLEAN10011432 [Myotis davidii]